MEQLDGKIKELESYRAKTANRQKRVVDNSVVVASVATSAANNASNAASVGATLTQDQLTQQAKESAPEVWSQKGSNAKMVEEIRRELLSIFDEHEDAIGSTANTKRHQYVLDSLDEGVRDDFMGYQTFCKFMSGQRQAKLKRKQVQLLQEFIVFKHPRKPTASDDDIIGQATATAQV